MSTSPKLSVDAEKAAITDGLDDSQHTEKFSRDSSVDDSQLNNDDGHFGAASVLLGLMGK